MLRLHKPFELFISRSPIYNSQRFKSAWIKASSTSSKDEIDVESLFIDEKVQHLLKHLTGLDVEGKIFTERNIVQAERSHFALMTDSMLEEARARMKERASKFLQFVPIKEPRAETFQVLSKDSEIEGFDNSKLVFTDISQEETDVDRTVVIREPDGTLRTALPEEHDRMNRVYYEQPNRPPFPPAVFKDPDLKHALDNDRHEFVLDFATWFYEPDDPAFVKLCHLVFDRTVEGNKFEILYSTRHFGSLVFYLILNDNIPPLLNFYGSMGSLHSAANVIRLQKIVFPNWRTAISFSDSDEKICLDFMKQNRRLREQVPDLLKLIETPKPQHQYSFSNDGSKLSGNETKKFKSRATITRENLRTEQGPLGDLSEEYKVKFSRDERDEKKKEEEKSKIHEKKSNEENKPQNKRPFRKHQQKVSTYKERLAEIESEKNKKD
uniref:28S ribosomal protein S22, mitochondrial n=1 Tax=Panagrolaimus sp. PS1159 TaxID=55785 RepID=A0AC35GP58_9BILA